MPIYTNPSSNTTIIPPTLKECNQDPSTCQFMSGILIHHTMYDAKCLKPLEGESIPVFIEGFNITVNVPVAGIENVFCGKCHYSKGVERDI